MTANLKSMNVCLLVACLALAGAGRCFAMERCGALDTEADPSDAVRFAAAELTNVLSRVGDGGSCAKDVVFHVGETDFAKSKGLSSAALQDEEWVVRSFGNDIVLNGGGSRGCLYAAYHFLEDVCGVRFFSDAETDVPTGKKRRDAASPLFEGLDLRGKPAFLYRDIYRNGDPSESTSLFAVRRRLNRNGDVPIPESMGGAFTYGPPYHCHTFDRLVPWGTYGKEHPEWFSLWEGKRTGGMYGGQLCLSNPEVRARLLEALRANIAAGDAAAKAAGVAAPRLYDVSQNDAYGRYCQCANCMEEVGKFGHSGFYLNVINSLADEIAKERPEIFLTTLAYEYTEPPPKGGVRPRDNVIVKLCDTRSNQALSIYDETNAKWRAFVESWGEVAKHLLVWDYAIVFVNPANFWPMPGEFAYGDLFRFYLKNNVAGVFMEHEHRQLVDMYDLKYYLETKLLENPEADVEALIRDFCDRYYGPAGRFVFEARRHLDRIARERKPYITFMPKPTDYSFIRREDAVRMKDLFDAAEKAVADTPLFLARVRRARNTTDAIWRIRLAEVDAKSGAVAWPAEACSVHDASRHALVDDPASPDGKAVRIGFPDVEFPPVPGFELYDAPKGKAVAKGEFVQAKDGAYAWTEVPDVTVPDHGNCFIYLAPDRTVQLRLWNPALNGKTFSLRILSRQDKSATYVARIEFVPDAAREVTVTLDAEKALGAVKPVNAVGQPPMVGAPQTYEMFRYLKDAGIPYSRLHDVGGAYGQMRYVDIPNIFRDFAADENDPKSYDFKFTDSLVSALVASGVEPYFRLGVTIENNVEVGYPAYRVDPPKDFAKWARICEHVIRHYTEGWADGFRHRITYWEIWNEPENNPDWRINPMFRAPFEEFMRLYGTVAPYLKSKFPHLKIGGYGHCGFYAGVGSDHVAAANSSPRMEHFVECSRKFLAEAKARGWPLDFFSFHSYSEPREALRQVRFADEHLNEFGFTADRTERHFNEWLPYVGHGNLGSAKQAAGIAAELIGLQNGPCDVACIYDARCNIGNYSPLFNPLTYRPHKAYYAFTAFNELRKRGTAVSVRTSDARVSAAAAKGPYDVAVMLANDSDAAAKVKYDFGKGTVAGCRLTDGERTDETIPLPDRLPPHSFVLLVVKCPNLD